MVTIEVPVRTLDDEIKNLESLAMVRMSFVRDRILAQLTALKWVRDGGRAPSEILKSEVPILKLAKRRESR